MNVYWEEMWNKFLDDDNVHYFDKSFGLHRFIFVRMYWIIWGFPGGSAVKNTFANDADAYSIPGFGKCPSEGNGNPLQYSCLGNPLDKGA